MFSMKIWLITSVMLYLKTSEKLANQTYSLHLIKYNIFFDDWYEYDTYI